MVSQIYLDDAPLRPLNGVGASNRLPRMFINDIHPIGLILVSCIIFLQSSVWWPFSRLAVHKFTISAYTLSWSLSFIIILGLILSTRNLLE